MSTHAFKNAALRLAPILTIGVLCSAGALAAEDPLGSLVGSAALGKQLKEDYGVKVYGWAQAGLIYNNNSTDDVSKQAFFNTDKGFNLNQLALGIQRSPVSNVQGRIGPFRPNAAGSRLGFQRHDGLWQRRPLLHDLRLG
ncbi:hypothetical protein NOV18_13505 [Pseudomonas asiatica]|uniref:Porin n=1 Tax=Pseudomonas asiatica TaxID=2219225 RepID=A0AAJ5LNQ0_9PSED|nr:hypothetical protein [Pseudomonas asiatica]UUC21433.1 hypothetical protein NOV18_13505 [Pseudomonas asiatica]